ncbi:MAG: hypothetical protein JRJ78_02465 [Deltaproteobacteria bacterium]|nr:hypothetical protein [Deltaproteobacteria bacterium]
MDNHIPDAMTILKEMWDQVLLLSVGNAYLCEERFLPELGRKLEARAEDLRRAIASLEKRFPGKFTDKVPTEDFLQRIQDTARRMQDPDREILARCTVGDVGRELEADLRSLKEAVQTIQDRVEGVAPTYSRGESLKNVFSSLRAAGSWLSLFLKLAAVTALLVVCVFMALYLTMERPGSLKDRISKDEKRIQVLRGVIDETAREKESLDQRIDTLSSGEMTREAKVKAMELEVRILELEKRIRDVEAEIISLESRIRENRERLEILRKKPFIHRLLRL